MPLLSSVTQESIRLWAYDPALYFKTTGEATLLQQTDWLPTLLELAADPTCPRQQEIQTLLEGFVQQKFLERDANTLLVIRETLEEQRKLLTTEWLILFMVNFNYIHTIFREPQRITDAASDKIAKELLQGSQPNPNYTKEAPLDDATRVYATAIDSLKQYLYINPLTGEWKTSKYLRWKSFMDDATL